MTLVGQFNEHFNKFALNVTLVEHFTGASLHYVIFLYSHKTTFKPFQTGLQKKLLKKLIPSGRLKYRVKVIVLFSDSVLGCYLSAGLAL